MAIISEQGAEKDLARRHCTVSDRRVIDLNATNVMPDVIGAKDAGSQGVAAWATSTGLLARILNARGQLGWMVPVVGHPSLGAGETGKLLAKPSYWEDAYPVGFRPCSYGRDGKLGPRQVAYVKKIAGTVKLSDTVLWYLAWGNDAVDMVMDGVTHTGSTAPEALVGRWNTWNAWAGLYGDYTFTPTNHNGYPSDAVVMVVANSFHNGASTIAPGY